MVTRFEDNPKACAKLVGSLYVVLLFLGPFSLLYVPSLLIVADDPITTASNIVNSESLFRLGLLGSTLLFLVEVVIAVALYILFRNVSYVVVLVALYSRIAMLIIQGVAVLLGLMAVITIVDGNAFSTLETEELYSLGLLFIRSQTYSGYVWGAFFGLHCAALAYLIYKSEFLPGFLGLLMGIAAFGYIMNSLGSIVFPDYQTVLASVSGLGAFVGEISFMGWLLIKNVDERKWIQLSKKSSEK